jgi:hypothetical protein
LVPGSRQIAVSIQQQGQPHVDSGLGARLSCLRVPAWQARQRPVFNNISSPPGVTFGPRDVPRGKLWPQRGMFTLRGEHTLLFIIPHGKTEGLQLWGIISPLGNKVHPWGPTSPLGAKLKTGLWN